MTARKSDGGALAPFLDRSKALEASQKGNETQKRRRELRKAAPDVQIEAATPELVAELLDAALGRGSFGDLKPSDRLKALQTALAYGLGRPGPQKPADEGPEPPTAASLFGAPPAE